jgi:uncharacterized protein YneF (UPF0154 family)
MRMDSDELALIILLVVSNLALGLGLGVNLARNLTKEADPPIRTRSAVALLVGMYFLECLAFAAGMATQVFTLGLAFLWGIVLGRWLRMQSPIPSLKFSLWAAIYTCLPTITFGVFIPIAWTLAGNSPLSAEAGISFGIPEWVPWPLGSVAGFAAALVLGTVLLKSVITVGEVSTMLHLSQRHPGAGQHTAA